MFSIFEIVCLGINSISFNKAAILLYTNYNYIHIVKAADPFLLLYNNICKQTTKILEANIINAKLKFDYPINFIKITYCGNEWRIPDTFQ